MWSLVEGSLPWCSTDGLLPAGFFVGSLSVMRLAGLSGLGSIVTAWSLGAPAWLLVLLLPTVLIICFFGTEPAWLDALGRLLGRGSQTEKSEKPTPIEAAEDKPKELDRATPVTPQKQRTQQRRRKASPPP